MLLTISRLSCLFEFSVEGFRSAATAAARAIDSFLLLLLFFYIIRMMFLGMLYPHQTYIIYFSSGMECFHPLNLTEDYYPAISFFKKINKFKKNSALDLFIYCVGIFLSRLLITCHRIYTIDYF